MHALINVCVKQTGQHTPQGTLKSLVSGPSINMKGDNISVK